MFLWDSLFSHVILLIGFKIVVCDIIIDKAWIPAIEFFNPVIEPNLKIIFVSREKGETPVDIVKRIVAFLKKASSVFEGFFLWCRKEKPGENQ